MKKTWRVVVDLEIEAEDAANAERIAVATLDGGMAWADAEEITYEIIETVMEGNDPE